MDIMAVLLAGIPITLVLGVTTGLMTWRDWRLGLLLPAVTALAAPVIGFHLLFFDMILWLIYLIVLLAARNHRRRREAMLRDLARPTHRRNRDELERMDLHDLE